MIAFYRTHPSFPRGGFSPAALRSFSLPAVVRRTTRLSQLADAHRKSRYCARPCVEFIEERQLMSTIPVFETVNVANGSFPSVQIAPMEQTVVNGYFTQASSSDVLKVNLQAGEIFTATLDVQYPVINTDWGSSLEIYDPHGNVVASQSTDILYGQNATDPTSGNLTDNNSVAFVAPISGTYPIVVAENAFLADAYFGPATYILTLRPVTLDTSTLAPDVNAQDAAKLQYTGGGLYAYLDANEDTLTFSGPTGRGFQISGQFSEVTTPVSGSSLTTSTITGTGTLTLQSGLGAIPLPLPPGLELVVTTDANGYDGLFGEVARRRSSSLMSHWSPTWSTRSAVQRDLISTKPTLRLGNWELPSVFRMSAWGSAWANRSARLSPAHPSTRPCPIFT